MEVFLFQQRLAGDRSSGFLFCTDLSHTTQSQVFLICCLIAARRVMSLTYGEWLFWIWIGGIGNYLARLSFQKCLLADVNLLPWWVPIPGCHWYWQIPGYYQYWDSVGYVGTWITRRARQRLGYWPRLCRGWWIFSWWLFWIKMCWRVWTVRMRKYMKFLSFKSHNLHRLGNQLPFVRIVFVFLLGNYLSVCHFLFICA